MSGGKGGRPEMRTSGFQRPFHPLQVLSWGVFGLDVLLYAVFGLPLVATKAAKVAVSVTYAASVAVLVAAAAYATAKNPADPFVLLKDEPEELERVDTENNPYCVTCDVPVRPRSKHCRECNKCVDVFDHHCMWLNNCIGAKNYAAFFTTICAVAVMVGIVLSTCGYLLVDYFSGACILEERIRQVSVFDPLPKGFFLGLLVVLVVVNFPLFVLDVQLIFLHLFLMSQQLTTYEYIMNKQGRLEMPVQDEKAPPKGGAVRLGRGIKTLPRCMDWIVFARCCRKRRPRRSPKDDAVQRISQQEEPSPRGGGPDVEAGLGAEPASPASAPEALKRELPVKAAASPPGSTVDAGDSPGAHSETPTPVEREHNDAAVEAPPSPAKAALGQEDGAETDPEASSNNPSVVVLQRTATPEEVRCVATVSSPRGLEVVGKHSSAASSTRGRRDRSRGTASARRRREVSCDDAADNGGGRSPVGDDERRSRRTSNRTSSGVPNNSDPVAVPTPPADAEPAELPQAQHLE